MMIDVKDRISTYPGRVKMTPVAGQDNTYDMVRADEPIEPGTPINRALFNAFSNDMEAMRQQVEDKMFELAQRSRIGDLSEGVEFGLYENGVLVPFIKLSNMYMSVSDAVLVIRKNCIMAAPLTDAGETYYDGCRTDRWLNTTYLSQLDAATQGVIRSTSVITSTAVSKRGTISRKVFTPSLFEYTGNTADITYEGSSIGYFNTAQRRTALLNGTLTNHWTRSIDGDTDRAVYITPNGVHEFGSPSVVVAGIRPMFVLPDDFEVTVGVPSTANVVANAEVI